MSVKHKPLLNETVAAGIRSEVAAFFSVTEEYRSTLHIEYPWPCMPTTTYNKRFGRKCCGNFILYYFVFVLIYINEKL
jgi:hypothetical protein